MNRLFAFVRRTLLSDIHLLALMLSCACNPLASASTLPEAAKLSDRSNVKSLLADGASVDERDEKGNTALHWAALNSDTRLAKTLLNAGASVDATNDAGATPLIYAIHTPEIVEALLEKGADPNHATHRNRTPLLAAASRPESSDVVDLLLRHGANFDPTGNIFAQVGKHGDLKTTRMLLDAGAPARDVLNASARGFLEIVKLLHEAGAEINGPQNGLSGEALNTALFGQRLDVAKYLIEQGANLEDRSPGGEHETPSFLWAAYNESGDTSIAEAMIARGADVNVENVLGETALDHARIRNNEALIELLLRHGARPGTRTPKEKKIPNNLLPESASALQPLIEDSINRSIELLQRTSDGYLNSGVVQRLQCVSCHQQTLPAITYGWAMERGFEVDQFSIARQTQDQVRFWTRNEKVERALQMGSPQPAEPIVIGYGLLGLAAIDYPLDDLTESMTRYLTWIQTPEGSWNSAGTRPPIQDGPIVATAFAVRSLQVYPIPGLRDETERRLKRARDFYHQAEPLTNNQQIFQLLGLGWAGEKPSKLKKYVRDLLAMQRDDGGWGQFDHFPSDSWATGLALIALNTAGGLSTNHDAYKKGIRFLLRTQFEDGSWYVRSRAWPFQPHFESGFPHGKDQWLSEGGTAWATMALLLTQPKTGENKQVDWMALKVPERYYQRTGRAESKTTKTSSSVQTVDYTSDIKPILERSCYGCHSSQTEKLKGGFDMEDRNSLLNGGQGSQPLVAIGNGSDSDLIWMVSDRIEDFEMPPLSKRDDHPALTAEEVSLIETWINEGLAWD